MSLRLTLRMAAPSIVISLLLLALGGIGAWYILQLQKSTANEVALDLATTRAVQQLVLSFTEIRSELAESLATGDHSHLGALPAKCAEAERRLRDTESLVDDPEEQALAAQVREGFERFQDESRGLAQAKLDDATRRAILRIEELADHGLVGPAKQLLAREEELGQKSHDYNIGMASHLAQILGLLAVCGAAAGLVAGVGIARSVTRSIVELYVPVRAAGGLLEEVVGPVDIVPAAGIENLDALLRRMAEHVGAVVERLRQSQLEVLRAEQMAALGHLSAGLAHELRNPLTSMKVLIQNAARATRAAKAFDAAAPESGGPARTADGVAPPSPVQGLTERDLAVLESETARLERSIQVFLDFARPPALERRLGDVRDALAHTIQLVQARAAQQRVALHSDVPDAPLYMDADHEQLRQVFLNLLCNALDILPEGGEIQVTAARSAAPPADDGKTPEPRPTERAPWITIRVTDSGPGLPADLGERIFEPYVSTKDTGLGLGLAICRQIVQSHRGRITACNDPKGGAAFTICLPGVNPADPQGKPCPES